MSHTLIIDDDKPFCRALGDALRRRGHTVLVAHSRAEALSELEVWRPDRAILDLRLAEESGLALLPELLTRAPELQLLVLTGFGSIATAVEAMRLGAIDYLTKPLEVPELLAAFERAEAVSTKLPPPPTPAPLPLDELEWEHVQRVLADCGGNITLAARRLGMHRRTLQRKLARGRP